jgi:hypothetical protein
MNNTLIFCKLKHSIFFLFILFGLNLEVSANADKQITIPSESVLEAQFSQSRHLGMIPKAIVSEGHLTLWEGHGLIWDTQTPFPNTILITKKGLYQLENEVKTPMVKGGDSAMFDVMAGIFNMKDAKDLKGFEVEHLNSADGHRRLLLKPQNHQVKNFIQSILLEGSTHITHVTISRPNGDRDEITIKGHLIKEDVTQQMRELFDE